MERTGKNSVHNQIHPLSTHFKITLTTKNAPPRMKKKKKPDYITKPRTASRPRWYLAEGRVQRPFYHSACPQQPRSTGSGPNWRRPRTGHTPTRQPRHQNGHDCATMDSPAQWYCYRRRLLFCARYVWPRLTSRLTRSCAGAV